MSYKIQMFKGIFNTTQQITIPGTTQYFRTVEEAMMAVDAHG